MWCGCRRADLLVSLAYPGMPRYFLAFLRLRQPLSLLRLEKRVVCCNSGELISRLSTRVGNSHWHDYRLMVRVVVGGRY